MLTVLCTPRIPSGILKSSQCLRQCIEMLPSHHLPLPGNISAPAPDGTASRIGKEEGDTMLAHHSCFGPLIQGVRQLMGAGVQVQVRKLPPINCP